MGTSGVLVKAAADLEEVSRSLRSVSLLLGDHMTATTPNPKEEDVTLWGAIELIDLNEKKVRNAIAAIDYLRGGSDGAGGGSAYERCLSEVMGE